MGLEASVQTVQFVELAWFLLRLKDKREDGEEKYEV